MGNQILFCQLGGFGDIIQTTNVLKVLKKEGDRVTYVTSTPYQRIMPGIRLADKVCFIPCQNRNDAFHGSGRRLMENFIEDNQKNYDRCYFPQVAFYRDILINKNKWQVVKTLFELCGINDYPVEPFDVHPMVNNMALEWIKRTPKIVGKKVIFVETESHSGQSFVSTTDKMVEILSKVIKTVQNPHRFIFLISTLDYYLKGHRWLLDSPFFNICDLPILDLLVIFKSIDMFIGCHSGLTNLYGCEFCYNPNVPVLELMYEFQKPVSIGPDGYPVIKQMKYICENDDAVGEIVKAMEGLP